MSLQYRKRNESMKWIMMGRKKENINTTKNIEEMELMENIRKRSERKSVTPFHFL
jgi:hypothetical protein